MTEAQTQRLNQVYQGTVVVSGIGWWLAAAASCAIGYAPRDLLLLLTLVPLVVVTGMFPNTFPLPSGLNLTQEKITFTLSDAIVLFVACWRGPLPAIFIAGIEGFTTSRRTVKRLPSNLFSFGMMALVAGASSQTLNAVLRYGFHEVSSVRRFSFPAAVIALLVANLAHIVANNSLFSIFFALRQRTSVVRNWCQNFLWLAPLALPTSAVASLMYITLQYDALIMTVIGAPLLVAIGLGHRRYRDSVQARIRLIEEAQGARVTTMEKAHRETIEALAVAINAKDEVTHEHVLRVQIYAAGVARILGCGDADIEALRAGALLHDIGKIAVPDYILNKPGKLTALEFEKMKMHTIVGAQILGRVDFPYPVVPIVRHHHERWDGGGYPDGLKGEEIPLTARILTVVDCFDALREDRQYRRGLSRAEALEFLLKNSGSQYDPRVVGLFITHLPEFEAEIAAHKGQSVPTYGIEPTERLSEAALRVAPAAGLATEDTVAVSEGRFSHKELRSFYDLVRTLGTASDRDELLSIFAESISTIVSHDTCAIALIAGP